MTKPKTKKEPLLGASVSIPQLWSNELAKKVALNKDSVMFKMLSTKLKKSKPLTAKQKADLEFKNKLSARLNALDRLVHDIAAEFGADLDTGYTDYDD